MTNHMKGKFVKKLVALVLQLLCRPHHHGISLASLLRRATRSSTHTHGHRARPLRDQRKQSNSTREIA